MEVEKIGRLSAKGRIEGGVISSLAQDRAQLLATSAKFNDHGNNAQHYQQQEQEKYPINRSMKMFNKVQVVYYLTRNGHLEHPHYLEVSHFATQPLRLKDVIDRLTVLRGKAMPCQYSWSCKRSYKSGYVWNDLSENDVIYASEGSEYVLKGSELLHERDFSETRVEDLEMIKRQQKKDHLKTNGLLNKPNATYQRQNYRKIANKYEKNSNNNNDDNEEDDEGEEKGSSDSSGVPYPTIIMEQEESYSLPSTSSTNSDKQQPQTPPPPLPRLPPQEVPKTSTSESKRFDKEVSRVIEEDGDPAVSTSLTRNSTVLLHLIACGGGGILCPQGKNKLKSNGGSNRNFNFSMKNSFMPCLKQQLSTRAISSSHNNVVPLPVKSLEDHQRQLPCKAGEIGNQAHLVASKEDGDGDEDEDMIMVKYMSENPRFGNLQSEEKEYFSGTIVEAMAQNHHHHHTHSSGSNASAHLHSQLPVLTKSSSYNELRCSKSELQAGVVTSMAVNENDDDDDEKDGTNFKGIIKLCLPRKKSFSCSCTKHS